MRYITISHAAHILKLGSRQAIEYLVVKGDLNPIWISKDYKGAVRVFLLKEVEKLASLRCRKN